MIRKQIEKDNKNRVQEIDVYNNEINFQKDGEKKIIECIYTNKDPDKNTDIENCNIIFLRDYLRIAKDFSSAYERHKTKSNDFINENVSLNTLLI